MGASVEGRQGRGEADAHCPPSDQSQCACLPSWFHCRKPTREGNCWEGGERKERLMCRKMRTKGSWVTGGFFDLEFLCQDRKHPLFKKPSVGTHGSH